MMGNIFFRVIRLISPMTYRSESHFKKKVEVAARKRTPLPPKALCTPDPNLQQVNDSYHTSFCYHNSVLITNPVNAHCPSTNLTLISYKNPNIPDRVTRQSTVYPTEVHPF